MSGDAESQVPLNKPVKARPLFPLKDTIMKPILTPATITISTKAKTPEDEIEELRSLLEIERMTIQFLIVGGFVSAAKAEQARNLVKSFKS